MNANAFLAAEKLLEHIRAPKGAVNTAVGGSKGHRVVVVYVAPGYWPRLGQVPKTFMGYEVVVERRGPATASAW